MGKIIKTERGHRVEPSVWAERKSEPVPDALIPDGRIVTVTFSFIQEGDASREAVDEMVCDLLNCGLDLIAAPILADTGASTDRARLSRQVLDEAVARYQRKRPATGLG